MIGPHQRISNVQAWKHLLTWLCACTGAESTPPSPEEVCQSISAASGSSDTGCGEEAEACLVVLCLDAASDLACEVAVEDAVLDGAFMAYATEEGLGLVEEECYGVYSSMWEEYTCGTDTGSEEIKPSRVVACNAYKIPGY